MKRFKERRDSRGKSIGNRNDTRVFQHKSNNYFSVCISRGDGMMKNVVMCFAVLALLLALCPLNSQAATTWKFYKTVPGPADASWSIIRLAADSTGKVYLSEAGTTQKRIYAAADFLTASATPTYTVLMEDNTMSNGLQGLVVDAANNVYVAGDRTADGNGSLRKFDAAGTLIWHVTPSLRAMGADLLSNGNVITCKFSGNIIAYNPATGAEIAQATTSSGNYVRDIAVIPDTVGGVDRIFGVRSGSLVEFKGGSVSNIIGYSTTELIAAKSDTSFQVRPSVAYSSHDNTLIWTNMTDDKVYVWDVASATGVQVLSNRSASEAFVDPSGVLVVDGGDGYQYLIVSSFWGNLTVYRSAKTYDMGKISPAPTIDGTMAAGEWGEATPVCTDFTQNGAPLTAVAEDLEVTVLYDDTYMYFGIQQANSNFSLDFVPSGGGRDPSGTGFAGDDYELFLYPGGPMASVGYHIVFFPNAADSICYVWDEAGTLSGWPGAASWNGSGDQAAFSYAGGILTIEYRIPWTALNLAGAPVNTVPADDMVWGVQFGHLNNNPVEYPNWSDSPVGGFVNLNNRPWGLATFTGNPVLSVPNWNQY